MAKFSEADRCSPRSKCGLPDAQPTGGLDRYACDKPDPRSAHRDGPKIDLRRFSGGVLVGDGASRLQEKGATLVRDTVASRDDHKMTGHLLDRWLSFTPTLERQYESTFGLARSKEIRDTIYLGLVLFNIHNLTNIFLLPDIASYAAVVRIFMVTPIALVLMAYIARMPAAFREYTALLIVSGAFLVEVMLFWLTEAKLGPYAFSEFTLTLVYGNMLLALRYRHAIAFTTLVFTFSLLAVMGKPSLDQALRFAFMVQIAMGCVMSLYANYRTERRRCSDYIVAYLATIQAGTDVLTGLPNRRLMIEKLDNWFEENCEMAIMMIDIDFFKLFNDTLGHPAGDDCLRQIGAVLEVAADHPDVFCARFGGEEFTVAVRNAEPSIVERMATGIVVAIEALGEPHPARADGIGVVTASVGVAFKLVGERKSRSELFAAADHALYTAKRNGRNRCVFAARSDETAVKAA